MLVGGAREAPGSDAAGVGVAAGEAAGSAVRAGSDNKESPISAGTGEVFQRLHPPPPQKREPKGKSKKQINK